MSTVNGQVKYSPEAARSRLQAFIERAPELDTYETFTNAVYGLHELPFAIASLYQHFGTAIEDTPTPSFVFFKQKGIRQIKGSLGRKLSHLDNGLSEVRLIEQRPRLLRYPRALRMATLSLVSDPSETPFDAINDYQTQTFTLLGAHNVTSHLAFIDRVRAQGGDQDTVARAITSGLVVNPDESRVAMRNASATLAKLSQGLLAVTEFEPVSD
ncbi:hypothetical protein KBD20_03695 [Candidatus Saccharibacteria bacterium]|nr:hypothetical protein [Candidatus Saccharibacteria bacterium]